MQNLRQLRLFLANPACASFFSERGVTANITEVCGAVIAPRTFYSSHGQKGDGLLLARRLSEGMLRGRHKVRAELLVWNPSLGQVNPYA